MYTLNLYYTSPETLKTFIKEKKLLKEKNLLLQIFTGKSDIVYIQHLIETVKNSLPHIKIIGTTTSGEIMEGKAQVETTVLSFSVFEKTSVETYAVAGAENSTKTAQKLIEKFPKDQKLPKVAITFIDGLHSNGEAFMRSFQAYNRDLIVSGGLAGDNAQFRQTIVFTEKGIFTHGAVTALLYSDLLQVVTKASFGWEPVGKTMTVTRAKENIVYEIDGQSALSIYSKYLGKDIANKLPQVGVEFPLIVKRKGMDVPRAPLGKNSDGSLVFAGNIDEGEKVTFGYGNLQAILQNGQAVYDDIAIQQSESIFVYSCMARLELLGESINEELLPLQNICNVSGFFTYGEFFVKQPSYEHELLNETMTILSLYENRSKKVFVPKYDYLKKSKSEQSLTLKALSHLISQTSKELEEFNSVLQERVREEVIKNNRKDKMLLQQTKLAQMGEMISMIAHQWRQPLSSISTLSQTINLRATLGALDEKTVIRLSDTITETAMHLSETIDDFREFFKPRKEKRETNYTEIVEGVLRIVENSITTKNIKLLKELQHTEKFNSYPNEIKQVVLNLLKNAQDAFAEAKVEEPYILIRTYEKENKHILEVCDNAGGVPEHLKMKIFEPYFSTKKKKDGTGLGLYMSKTIIEEHCEGRLCVENSEEGAVFRIELPANLEKENR